MGRTILSIVIGTYNRLALLRKCLDALEKGVHVVHEIIVVDGGSTDGTLEYLAPRPRIRLVRDETLVGQAKSLNHIFASLTSEFVCWLSDDNIVMDKALDITVDILKKNLGIGIVGLKIKDVTGPYTYAPYLGAIWESGVLNCNQGMLPTKLLRQLGGFNEEFRDYGIDADLTTRVLLAGYKAVYTKKVAIQHYRDHDTDNWITKADREQRLQSARELYRRRYAMLIPGGKTPPGKASSHSNTNNQSMIAYFRGKFLKHYRIFFGFIMRCLMNETLIGHRISAFFRDWHNITEGRYISRWDLFENFHHSYYLVQQIPESLRLQFQNTKNSTSGNG